MHKLIKDTISYLALIPSAGLQREVGEVNCCVVRKGF